MEGLHDRCKAFIAELERRRGEREARRARVLAHRAPKPLSLAEASRPDVEDEDPEDLLRWLGQTTEEHQ